MELENRPFSLYDLLKSVVNLFQMKAKEKGIILSHDVQQDTPDMIIGDVARLRQILTNLVRTLLQTAIMELQ